MKKSFTIVILIMSLVLTFLCVGVYYYMYSKLLANNEQVVTLEEEARLETGEEDTTRTLRSSVQATSQERALLHSLFIGKDETASIIEKLEGIATLAHVSHELSIDVKSDDVLATGNKELLVTGLKTSGTWSETYRFLALLENLPYKVNITNVRLDRAQATDQSGRALPWLATISAQFIKEK